MERHLYLFQGVPDLYDLFPSISGLTGDSLGGPYVPIILVLDLQLSLGL